LATGIRPEPDPLTVAVEEMGKRTEGERDERDGMRKGRKGASCALIEVFTT